MMQVVARTLEPAAAQSADVAKVAGAIAGWRAEWDRVTDARRVVLAQLICAGLRLEMDLRARMVVKIAGQRAVLSHR